MRVMLNVVVSVSIIGESKLNFRSEALCIDVLSEMC